MRAHPYWSLAACRRRDAKRARQNRWVKAQRRRAPLERSLEGRAVECLEALGFPALKVGYDGWPDRLVLLGGGDHLWLEFKRAKFGSLTPAQRRRIPRLRKGGDEVHVVRTMEQVYDAMKARLSWAWVAPGRERP